MRYFTGSLFVIFAAVGALAARVEARDMTLTIYDDGISCPGDCDAHVAINSKDNGSRYAFDPASSRAAPVSCKDGRSCMICFSENDDSCMSVTYRGSGPPSGTFDFTPTFYAENCSRPGIPDALARQCAALDGAVAKSGYDTRINCFETPDHASCVDLMTGAKARFQADAPIFAECIRLGEDVFNAAQPDASTRRDLDCAYTQQSLGGPNSSGKRWRMLLPGACRPGTYVGRDGNDCCSGDRRFAASVHPECSGFFPRR